jgi:hypothetical protein
MDETDYVARVTALIRDPAARTKLGQVVARQVASFHGHELRRAYLHAIYERLSGVTHQPVPVAIEPSAEMEHDLHLASFNDSHIKRAVLQLAVNGARDALTIRELFRILTMSLRIGDTRPTLSHVVGWLAILWHIVVPRRPPSES